MTHYKMDKPLFMFNTYVQSLSTSIGWGGQGGTMSIKLIEDPDPPPHNKDDPNWVPRTLKSNILDYDEKHADCDNHEGNPDIGHPNSCPHEGLYGFDEISDRVGSAAYFVYDQFRFGGVFQRMQRAESVGSGRTIDLVLESPSKLMDGVQVIIGEFNGMTDRFLSTGGFGNTYSTNLNTKVVLYGPNRQINGNAVDNPIFGNDVGVSRYSGFGPKNVYNVFGYLENPITGSFGGSNFNSAGMQIGLILDTLQGLGVFRDPATKGDVNPFGGMMHFMDTEYSLDIGELITSLGSAAYNYRVSGPVKSLNSLISEVCDMFQLDYYWMIEPEDGWDSLPKTGGIVNNGGDFIKEAKITLKVTAKGAPPNEHAIEEFIEQERDAGNLISSNFGREYADAVSQRLIYGGARTRYQAIPIADCVPILGQNSNSTYQTKNFQTTSQIFGGGSGMTSSSPTTTVPVKMRNSDGGGVAGVPDPYYATLWELRMALGGKQTWEIFKTFETMTQSEPNGLNNIFTCPWTGAVAPTLDILQAIGNGELNCRDMLETNGNRARKGWVSAQNKKCDIIFKAVSGMAGTFALQEFIVPVVGEYNEYSQMAYVPPGDFEEIRTWEVSDAAFLQQPIVRDLKFLDGQGRQKSMSVWPQNSTFDYSNLGSDWAAGTLGVCSTKGSPDKEQYWLGDTFGVPFKCGAQVRIYDQFTTPDFGLTVLAKYCFGVNVPPAKYCRTGKNGVQFPIPPDIAIPLYACIPQESTRYRFGPWGTNFGLDDNNETIRGGFNGKAEVVADESLRPETFGSWSALFQVGAISATLGVEKQAALETGTVEVHGAPLNNIGERFVSTGPYVTDMSINTDVSGGVKTSYKLSTYTPNFGKLAKYNIDRIARINKNVWAAAKKQRDKIEKRPLPKHKFEKTDFSTGGPKDQNRWNAQDANAVNWGIRQNVLVNQNNMGQNQGGGGAGNPGNPGGP